MTKISLFRERKFRKIAGAFIGLLLFTFPAEVITQCALNGDVILGSGPCTYQITAAANFYTNRDLTTMLQPPIFVKDNDFVVIGFHLVNTSRSTNHLLLETCWATKTEDHVIIDFDHTIVDFPGCPNRRFRSVVSVTNNGVSENVTIRFPVFFIYKNQKRFYIHCTVGACDNCQQTGCESQAPVEQTYTRTAAVVTIGPIQRTDVTDPSSPTSSQKPTPGLIAAICVFAVVIFLLLVAIIAYLCYPLCEQRHMEKSEAKGYNKPVIIKNKRLQSTSSTADNGSISHAANSYV